jgi:MFS transporter, DHA2 family, multidrug resistance protein
VAAAEQLPHGLGAELLGTAREAFTQAFQLTAALSAAVVLITALLATVLLRRVRVGSPLEQQAESLS